MKRRFFEEQSQDQSSGIHHLFGPVELGPASDLGEQIIEANIERKLPRLQLLINSPGGNVNAGFAVIDLIHWSEIPIHTVGLGLLASMGLLVFMTGERGQRVITRRTSILSHRYSAWAAGNHSELVASRKQQDLTHCRIVNHYIQHTNVKTEAELNRTLLRDTNTWLTPEEAIELGIADQIQEDRSPAYPFIQTDDLQLTMQREAIRA